ncbi:MAG: electron transfer flavoprotein subunit beta/FixA family protein [Nocardiopsis sp. BM-2018]|nr:MAG: electron transfer flavoprotein subunit beta/FixA family protein [Nocardiopsis sp. BM-2018]
MTIVSILKHVPDAESRVRAKDGALDLGGATYVIDGMDEYGVEQALRVRESGVDAEVVAVAYGPAATEQALRTALAMGADRGVLCAADDLHDPLAVAARVAETVRDLGATLVFVGGKQADWDSAALGPALAEVLGWPHVDWATAFELQGDAFEAVHDVDDGSETLRGQLPVVVTTQQGLNEPRYPTLPNIMKARRKPLDVESAETATGGFTVGAHASTERERRREVLEGDARSAAAALVRKLRDEAKVLRGETR